MCINWRLGVKVAQENDEHKRIKADGARCLEV